MNMYDFAQALGIRPLGAETQEQMDAEAAERARLARGAFQNTPGGQGPQTSGGGFDIGALLASMLNRGGQPQQQVAGAADAFTTGPTPEQVATASTGGMMPPLSRPASATGNSGEPSFDDLYAMRIGEEVAAAEAAARGQTVGQEAVAAPNVMAPGAGTVPPLVSRPADAPSGQEPLDLGAALAGVEGIDQASTGPAPAGAVPRPSQNISLGNLFQQNAQRVSQLQNPKTLRLLKALY